MNHLSEDGAGRIAGSLASPGTRHDDDEISLGDLLKTLWRGRGLIVLLPALAMTAAALYAMWSALDVEKPVEYYIELEGVDNAQYPNGTAFSPRDLLIPDVLAEVRHRFSIPSDVEIRDALSVAYDSPMSAALTQAYRRHLSDRGLSADEIAAINEEYERQLRAEMMSRLRIEVNHHMLGADAATGALIARAIPEIWSQVLPQRFRIFTDTRLADLSVTRTAEDLESTASILIAKQRMDAMERGLEIMMEDNRLSLLRTDEGYTLEDMIQGLRRFRTVYFNMLVSSGFEPGDAVGAAYSADLGFQLADLRRQRASYEDTLRTLREFQRAPAAERMEQSRTRESGALQLSETGLSEILQLAQRSSFADFIQRTLRERQEIDFAISEIEREMATISQSGDEIRSDDFRQQAERALEELTRRYSELVERSRARMREQAGELYTPVTAPIVPGSPFPERMILMILLAGGVGGLLAMVIVFARSSLRESAGKGTAYSPQPFRQSEKNG